MCGVAGVISHGSIEENRAVVADLNRRQTHRGPDHADLWSDAGAVLGHTRLAIVDLTDGGRQPFVSTDGMVTVIFNGEIYNHEELRRKYFLLTPSRCDGSILPELWQRLGTDAFGELRGMYSIAIYDARQRSVTLARDPFGIKPLHWTRTANGGLVFASEARALLHLVPQIRLRRAALEHYLAFGSMERDQSPFAEIESVRANGWSQWNKSMVRTDGVVKPDIFSGLPNGQPADLRAEFLESVSLHLVSDVPMALLLSSGLDSSALAWACAELGSELTCITVDLGGGASELQGAAEVAGRYGHRHEIVSAEPDADLVTRYFNAMQRPSVDGLNVFLVSQAVASLGIRTALSGLGGDEVLAGYPAFKLLRYLPLLRAGDTMSATRLLARTYRGDSAKLAQLLSPAGPRNADGLGQLFRRVLMDDQIRQLVPWTPTRGPVDVSRDDSAHRMSLSEITRYLGGTLLPDTDAYSMDWSVEMRVPFVDVEFASALLAIDHKRGFDKRRFAHAVGSADLVSISQRRKQGFSLPMDTWMRSGPLARAVHATESPDAPVRQLLRPAGVDHIVNGWRAGRLTWSRAWSLIALNSWLCSLDDLHGIGSAVLAESGAERREAVG